MRAYGYKRHKGRVLRDYKPIGDKFFVISLASDKYGYIDLFGGGEFYVSLQIVDQLTGERFDVYPQPMEQLNRLLSNERLEELRAIQNQAIMKRTPPSLDDERLLAFQQAGGGTPESILRLYYQPVTKPYTPEQGAWFRYSDAADIRQWIAFVCEVLPASIARFFEGQDAHSERDETMI